MHKDITISPYFLDTEHGNLFVIEYCPRAHSSEVETVIIIPPFAEEMNRCRRMMSMQARALAAHGLRAILVDLHGTGDSEGDFSDARWSAWCDNIASVASAMTDAGRGSVSFLAIRLGALVLFDRQSELVSRAHKIVLWNPCTKGSVVLRQFLRIRIAAQMSENNDRKESIPELMEKFAAGETVEVAGYEISPELAKSMSSAMIVTDSRARCPTVHWFELVASPSSPLPVACNTAVEQMRRDRIDVSVTPLCGEKFWNTVETTVVPALIDATTSAFVQSPT